MGTVRLRTSVNSDPLGIQTRASETKLPCSSSAMGMGAGFSRHPFRELCYGIFRYGGPWSPLNGRPMSLTGKPCSWELGPTLRLGESCRPQSHRRILSSPWTPSSTLSRQTEHLGQLRSLGISKQSHQIKPALFLDCNAHGRGLSRHPHRELCSGIFQYRGSCSHLVDFPGTAGGHLVVWSSCQAEASESPQVFLRLNHHSLAIMDDISSVSEHLTLALPHVLELSRQPLHIGTATCSELNITVACVFTLRPHMHRMQALHIGNSGA